MISSKIVRFLLGAVLLIVAIYCSSSNSKYTDDVEKNPMEFQASRHRRAIKPNILYCKVNQYYDEKEGRCLGMPGGGRMVYINSGQSCGINLLKPHCTSSLYYYICKQDKTILAQCANEQFFSNRLQRCVYNDPNKLYSNTIRPEFNSYNHVQIPSCTRPGRFPVPDHCSMFYTCDTNGHRLFQNIFKCPQNMGYQENIGTCATMSNCRNDNSVDSTICVPDTENMKSLNSNEAVEENIATTSWIPEETKTLNINNSTAKAVQEFQSGNEKNLRIDNTPVIDNPLSVNTSENIGSVTDDSLDANVNSSPANLYDDVSVPNDMQSSSNPLSHISDNKLNEHFTLLDDTTLPKGLLTTTDESNPADAQKSSLMPEKYYESTTLQDVRTEVNSPVTSNVLYKTDGFFETSTIDGAPSPIDNTRGTFDELRNEDSSLSRTNSQIYSMSKTESDDATHSSTMQSTSKIREINYIPDISTYSSIGSGTTETISSFTTITTLLDKDTQSMITEQYKRDEKRKAVLTNSNIEFVDQNSTPKTSDVTESTNGFSTNDFHTSLTQTSDTVGNVDHYSTAGLPETYTLVDDKKIADDNLRMLYGSRSASTPYSLIKTINNLDSVSTTARTLISENVTQPMLSTNITQDLSMTQTENNNMEISSPASLTEQNISVQE